MGRHVIHLGRFLRMREFQKQFQILVAHLFNMKARIG